VGELAFNRGEAAEKAGRLDAAYEEFQAASALDHPSAAARVTSARSALVASRLRQARQEMANQNPKAAIPLYDRVLTLDPSNDTAKLERQRAVELVKKTGG
jgi:tetratricopeptide (TPR) repeat protein